MRRLRLSATQTALLLAVVTLAGATPGAGEPAGQPGAHCALALRISLWRAGGGPWNYAALLNAASDRLLMRRVGGGFSFWHLHLRDFLAEASPEQLVELHDAA